MPKQKRDVCQRADECEQPTEYAAEVTGRFTVEMAIVGVATATLGQHRPELPKGKRAGESEEAASQPNKQDESVASQFMRKSASGTEDAGPDHGGDHGGRRGPKPQRAIGGGRTHFSLAK